ncbi:hypothetical protein [Clostridium merdae]|uniref:hypothetical protein n=1 Tax=Clostridium merdae TaxID=1958780 RepID=UPI000A269C2E|nr:hypothetical protein [Clostridium merdae]
MIKGKPQTHNDGTVRVYRVDNIALPGNKPKEGLVLKHTLRYKERTVGLTRVRLALQTGAEVSYVLRVPRLREVSPQDVAVPNDGLQYRITRVQYPEDTSPPKMDLELERLECDYAVP